jgi:hypothetical protein
MTREVVQQHYDRGEAAAVREDLSSAAAVTAAPCLLCIKAGTPYRLVALTLLEGFGGFHGFNIAGTRATNPEQNHLART